MADTSEEEWKESPKKKLKKYAAQCITHCSLDRGKLISVTNIGQWNILLEAAGKVDHIPLLEIAKNVEERYIPDVKYHKNCRSTVLMRSHRLESQSEENPREEQVITFVLSRYTHKNYELLFRHPIFINMINMSNAIL